MYFFLKKLLFKLRLNVRKIKAYYLLNKWQVYIYDNVTIDYKPKKTSIGKNLSVLPNSVLELHSQSEIVIGDYCTLSYGVVVCIIGKLQIGNYVMIGEYTSIRDTTHEYNDTTKPMKEALDKTESIIIGNNVWIGRGCLIQPGTVIEDGVVIAANSTVKGVLEANAIYGGNPAKLIKRR